MIPVCEPHFIGNEIKYVNDAIASKWISSKGKYLDAFENKFSEFLGVNFATATTNGTTALHLALRALDVCPGDEVIMPTFTMISCAFAIRYCGATPIFVDCCRDTWNMNSELIEEKITNKTKAIMVVHIYGHPTDMDHILAIAKKYNLHVIEDAAEGIGSIYKGKKCGSIGTISCFSFYANKMITCGEGGMVCTNNEELYERCRLLKNLSFPLSSTRTFLHEEVGFNYRMTNIQAALGLAQLERINDLIKLRRRIAHTYKENLSKIDGLTLPIEKDWAFNSYWMYGIIVEDDFLLSREHMLKLLKENKNSIDTRLFFTPMHLQPSLKDCSNYYKGQYPVAEDIFRRGFYLPTGSGLSIEQVEYICNSIIEIAS